MPKSRMIEPYKLYRNARNLWRSKIEFQLSHEEATQILRDVHTAAGQGDWGAKALMAHFYLYGLGALDTNKVLEPMPEKSIEIVRAGISAGQPWAYYDLGVAYENSYADVPYDKDIAWAYYKKAAELGSPDAQMALADAYRKANRDDAAATMVQCAFKQGHGPAAYYLGIHANNQKDFSGAIRYYQSGASFGSEKCAWALMFLFDGAEWNSLSKDDKYSLRQIQIEPDIERSKRYEEIADALKINPDLRLTLLDKFIPLPPSKLPAWRGVTDAVEPDDYNNVKY